MSTKKTKKNIKKNDESFDKIIDEIKRLPEFILIDRIIPIKLSTISTLKDAQTVLNVIDDNDDNDDMVLFGIIRVWEKEEKHAYEIYVYMDDLNKKLLMQIEDIPKCLWFELDTIDKLQNFTNCYVRSDGDKKSDRYASFLGISPTTLERFILINKYLNKNVHGSTTSDDINDVANKINSFDLAIKYETDLQQYDEKFELTTFTKYTGSTISIKLTHLGLFIHVTYISCGLLSNIIEKYNNVYKTSIAVDVPLDVFMFLILLEPQNRNSIIDQIYEDKTGHIMISTDIVDIISTLSGHLSDLDESVNIYANLIDHLDNNILKKDNNDDNDDIDSDIEHDIDMIELINTKQYIKRKISTLLTQKYVDLVLLGDTTPKSQKKIIKMISEQIQKDKAYKYTDEIYTTFMIKHYILEPDK